MNYFKEFIICLIYLNSINHVNGAITEDLRHELLDTIHGLPYYNVTFWLYTRDNPTVDDYLDPQNDDTICNSHIKKDKPIKWLIHGGLGRHTDPWFQDMKSAFLEEEDCNIIMMDWDEGALGLYWIRGVAYIIIDGKRAAYTITLLMQRLQALLDMPVKPHHLIGHSLAGPMMASTGEVVKKKLNTSLSRITGLDPVGFRPNNVYVINGLNTSNADFVDIIHTNTDWLIIEREAVGHVDFFVNGGNIQPSCQLHHEFIEVCSHFRAIYYFTESIRSRITCENNCTYKGYPCPGGYEDFEKGRCLKCEPNCGEMGYFVQGRGVYYLKTREITPFCGKNVYIRATIENLEPCGNINITIDNLYGQDNISIHLWNRTEKDEPNVVTHVGAMPEKNIPPTWVAARYLPIDGLCESGIYLTELLILDDEGNQIFRHCNRTLLLGGRIKTLRACGEAAPDAGCRN